MFETHLQADHVSGLPELASRTGATAYLPAHTGVEFGHHALTHDEVVTLGNTQIRAVATPGHALAHHYRSLTERLLALPDDLILYPAHYSGSVCGRGLSANPISSIGFERRHNPALQFESEDAFVEALTSDIPPMPAQQAAIVAANRSGRPLAEVA